MKLLNKDNEKFIKHFFETHKLFFYDDLPWKLYNIENGKFSQNTNLHTRIEYLFSKNGFFNETYKERDPEYIKRERLKHLDYSFYHRQRRYIVQESIANNFHNPTHHSFTNESKEQIDFNNLNFDGGFQLVTHPGNTRFESSCFLNKNLNKCLIYVNKDEYYEGYFKNKLVEIKSIDEVYDYWKPVKDVDKKNLTYNFLSPRYFRDDIGYKNGTKYHDVTNCNVLKLWELGDSSTINKSIGKIKSDDLLHSKSYIDRFFDSSEEIAEIMFEKKLTLYTDSKDDIKSYFDSIRNKLIKYSELISKKKGRNYYFDNVKHFKFDVVVVDEKPKNISKLNGNKGFAIWIDKSIINNINREIYEFTFFTRKDIKSAETEDGKLSITNCRDVGEKKWKIHKEFYL